MKRAGKEYKNRIVDILTLSFQDNKSVNYVVPQDGKRMQRIRQLMAYSFEVCHRFGEVFITEDGNGCALVLLPEKKRTTMLSMWWDVKFIITSIGVSSVMRAMSRENKIKSQHPNGLLYYIWFIGVDVKEQSKGIGSKLLSEVINEGEAQNRVICLETSTIKNLPWYQKFGFSIYNELDFGYTLFCMKRSP